MQCIREIIEPNKLKGIINLPQEMRKSKVEIIVLPSEEPLETASTKKKLQASEELNNLLAGQSKKKLDEFDQIVSQRNPFRKTPIQL